MELTRDHRTVFVGQLVLKADEKKISKFFKKFGPVSSVLLLRDKFTNRSKGIAYVEMTNLDDVPKVLLMNGQVPDFQVFPIMVKTSEAEKNFVAKKETEVQESLHYVDRTTSAADDIASRIRFSNLHEKISEEDLRTVFQSFGEVMSVEITRNEKKESNGVGFIQFGSEQDAKFALSKADGLELAGKYLKLSRANTCDSVSAPSASYHNNYDSWKLDDDENIGVQMTSHSRTALMAKLARGSDVLPTSNVKPPPPPVAPAPTTTSSSMDYLPEKSDAPPVEGSKSFCFVMKNMFDPATEVGMDWHIEIKEDVEAECSKYGRILHSYVDKDKAGGLVYILFDNTSSAVRAVHQMHGRWFNKKQVLVRYLSSQEYVGMFPEARSAVQEARST